ncbi:hypothetical protein KJ359_012031 [Pestalotiopsis sp. 9143b]|nr:hypothetical protein KJ359_012031 [Pestalotiopsis sp. 9143b]
MSPNDHQQIRRPRKGRVSHLNYHRAADSSQHVTGDINPCDICPYTGDICPPHIRNVADRRRWFKKRIPKSPEPETVETTAEKEAENDPFVLSETEKQRGAKPNAFVSAIEDSAAEQSPGAPDDHLAQAMDDARDMVARFPMAPGRRQRAATMVVVNGETGSPEVVPARGRLRRPRGRTLPASRREPEPEPSPSPPEPRRGDEGGRSRKPSEPIDIRSPRSPTAKRQYRLARGMKEGKISGSGRSYWDPNAEGFTPSPAAAKKEERGGAEEEEEEEEEEEGLMYLSPGGSGDEISPEDLALLAAFGRRGSM